mmetsp:Transcript_29113/g.61808  ORF Transcript_29113/g.61808 Transcript_29113/m.61808 type:complete len:204 (-) Transcript_29113:271-882(-)
MRTNHPSPATFRPKCVETLHSQHPGGGGGRPAIRKSLQPRDHVPAHDPTVRRREDVAVHPIHDPPVLWNEIAKVLQPRVPLEHARRQVPHQSQQRQQYPVHRPEDHPVRPVLHPRPQCRQRHAKRAASNDALDRLVRARLPGGGADGAKLGLAELPPGEVAPHVAEGDADPGPEDEVGPGRDGESDRFGEEGGELRRVSESVE